MSQLLLIDDDPGTLTTFELILRREGHKVLTSTTGRGGLHLAEQERIDLVLADLCLPDMTGLDILRWIRETERAVRVVIMTGFGTMKDAIAALRLGAADFLEKPIIEEDLVRTVAIALGPTPAELDAEISSALAEHSEAHAAVRWARALMPIIDASSDPRTLAGWSRLAYASPGALRNWCRAAGVSARRSLVFARLLRATVLASQRRQRPENLLDVVDRRTLAGLLKFAGFSLDSRFPESVLEFLDSQRLVSDADALFEIKRAIQQRHSRRANMLVERSLSEPR